MSMEFQDTSETLRQTLEKTIDEIDGRQVTLREIMKHTGEQGLLLLCALLTLPFLLPVSIPGVSTVFGLAIIMISIGITLNRTPWLPGRITDRPIDSGKLVPTLKRGAGIVEKIETVIKPRLKAVTEGAAVNRFNGLMLLYGGVLLLFPLGLVPFSNTLPGYGILFLAVGISQRDGLLVVAGYVMMIATTIYFGVLAWIAFAAGRGLAGFFGG
ncbi:MAG: exopolysaccharide biosynthesis protein [Rhizobiaceae bacterium]|nr:exopolysaccharide biosynthesis protein [Rhizobiaceae bacterium]MCV0408484.1 exopolysaccharide biosynthesis protein [Rhizobiaceae bacterium]